MSFVRKVTSVNLRVDWIIIVVGVRILSLFYLIFRTCIHRKIDQGNELETAAPDELEHLRESVSLMLFPPLVLLDYSAKLNRIVTLNSRIERADVILENISNPRVPG